MAEPTDTSLFPRTYFRAPRVPFDFRALVVAILGYLVWWGGSELLTKIFDVSVSSAFLAAAARIFADIPYIGFEIAKALEAVFQTEVTNFRMDDANLWHVLVGGLWFFGIWSFVGQAIHRITALRIARDEGLTLMEALRFAWSNWPTILLAPLIVLGTITFFYLCNMLAGALIAIPWAGQIFALILVPLTWIATLLILLVALGGVFGLPLVGSAAAWERNGSLDAISRAFSYIFARPLQFFWNYFLIFMFVGIVLVVGQWFIHTHVKSVDAGIWSDIPSVMIDAPPRVTTEGSDWTKLDKEAQDLDAAMKDARGMPAGLEGPRRAPEASPHAISYKILGKAPVSDWLTALVFFVFLNLTRLAIFAYAIWWFIGASTSVYADLREDVDGTPEDEIYLEEEQEEAALPPPPAGGGATPPPAPPPAPPPPAPAV